MKTSELIFTFTFTFREDSMLSSTEAVTSELVLVILWILSYYVVIWPLFSQLIINVSIYALFDDTVNILWHTVPGM